MRSLFRCRLRAASEGRPGLALVALTVVEQRYRAVLAVEAGERVVDVAARLGVSRQTVPTWLSRYRIEGLAGLMDRSRRPGRVPTSGTRRWRRRCASCGGSTPGGVPAAWCTYWADRGGRRCRRGWRCIGSWSVVAWWRLEPAGGGATSTAAGSGTPDGVVAAGHRGRRVPG